MEAPNIWADLKTDTERAEYLRSGNAWVAGIVAHAIQDDLADAYDRLAAKDAEIEKMRNERNRFRNLLIRADLSIPVPVSDTEDEDNPISKQTVTVGLVRDIRAALKGDAS